MDHTEAVGASPVECGGSWGWKGLHLFVKAL